MHWMYIVLVQNTYTIYLNYYQQVSHNYSMLCQIITLIHILVYSYYFYLLLYILLQIYCYLPVHPIWIQTFFTAQSDTCIYLFSWLGHNRILHKHTHCYRVSSLSLFIHCLLGINIIVLFSIIIYLCCCCYHCLSYSCDCCCLSWMTIFLLYYLCLCSLTYSCSNCNTIISPIVGVVCSQTGTHLNLYYI
jgi:hypothetical protein